jgi:hypothetical protein
MKVFFLSSFAVFCAMSASMPSALLSAGLEPLQKELAKLESLAQERADLFAELLQLDGPALAARNCEPEPPKNGLRTGGLVTGSVQGASGLGSGARGLTPESEWRKMFPKKPGQ